MATGHEPASFALDTASMPASFVSVEYGQLEKMCHLGSGGFGTVYLCRHRQWGKVAVKQVIFKDVTEERKNAFRKEVRNLWHVISSGHTVSVMGMTENPNDGIYIIMEYLEYGNLKNFTLSHMVSRDPQDPSKWLSNCWPRRIRMICDIILGMNFIHTSKPSITHRDLKLENIFVGEGFKVKIGDFGLSVSSLSACQQKGRIGTITHIPPEVLSGKYLTANQAFDIYSFAITLFEFVALTEDNKNEVPYQCWANDALIELWVVTSNMRPNFDLVLQDTPEILLTTMKQCWDEDYKKRPTFQDLLDKFRKFFDEKYDQTSLYCADMAIMQDIAYKRTTSRESDSDIHSIHNGSSCQTVKSKKPVQTTSKSLTPPEQPSNHDRIEPIIPSDRVELCTSPSGEDRVDSIPITGNERKEVESEQESFSEVESAQESSAISPLKSSNFRPDKHLKNHMPKENLAPVLEDTQCAATSQAIQPSSTGDHAQSILKGEPYSVNHTSQQPSSSREQVKVTYTLENEGELQVIHRNGQQGGATAFDDAGIDEMNKEFSEKLYVRLPNSKQDTQGAVTSVPIQVSQIESPPQSKSNQCSTNPSAFQQQTAHQNSHLQARSRSPIHQSHNARSPGTSPKPSKKSSKDAVVTNRHIMRIEKHVGMKYTQLGRALGLSDPDIDTLYFQYKDSGLDEVAHRILTKWIGKNGKRATKSVLVKALEKAELAHLCGKV